MLPRIDYKKISDSIFYYESLGYSYIEVPWVASKESMEITCPKDRLLFSTFIGNLIGSGEQSFLNGRQYLPKGKFLCATPCFRDEPVLDQYHLNYFFKTELIITHSQSYNDFHDIIGDAFGFFEKYINHSDKLRIIETEQGKDIILNGIEVGSYGIRSYKGFDWVYGTGCAEPRLSQILNK